MGANGIERGRKEERRREAAIRVERREGSLEGV